MTSEKKRLRQTTTYSQSSGVKRAGMLANEIISRIRNYERRSRKTMEADYLELYRWLQRVLLIRSMDSTPILASEYHHQVALAEYLDACGVQWTHVPNEGKHHIGYRMKQKRQGVKKGVPDVLIFTPPPVGGYVGAALELKKAKGGALSSEQRDWLRELKAAGWAVPQGEKGKVRAAHGVDEAISWLEGLGYQPKSGRNAP